MRAQQSAGDAPLQVLVRGAEYVFVPPFTARKQMKLALARGSTAPRPVCRPYANRQPSCAQTGDLVTGDLVTGDARCLPQSFDPVRINCSHACRPRRAYPLQLGA